MRSCDVMRPLRATWLHIKTGWNTSQPWPRNSSRRGQRPCPSPSSLSPALLCQTLGKQVIASCFLSHPYLLTPFLKRPFPAPYPLCCLYSYLLALICPTPCEYLSPTTGKPLHLRILAHHPSQPWPHHPQPQVSLLPQSCFCNTRSHIGTLSRTRAEGPWCQSS